MSPSDRLRISAERCRLTGRKFPGQLTLLAFETLAAEYEMEAERIERGGRGIHFGPARQ